MSDLSQDGVRRIAARIAADVVKDVDHEAVNDRTGALLDESDFTGPEWERAVRAITNAIGSANVTTGWPTRCRGCGQGIASTPLGWASLKAENAHTLVLACPTGTSGARHEPPDPAPAPSPGDRVLNGGQSGTLVRCVECSGSGLLHQADETSATLVPRKVEGAADTAVRDAAVAKVKAKLADLMAAHGDRIGLDELVDELDAQEVATESLGNGRWYEDILNVLLVDGQHVGVITEEGLTERQENPGAKRWRIVSVKSEQKTSWSVDRKPRAGAGR